MHVTSWVQCQDTRVMQRHAPHLPGWLLASLHHVRPLSYPQAPIRLLGPQA
jgi:hypothetical protein